MVGQRQVGLVSTVLTLSSWNKEDNMERTWQRQFRQTNEHQRYLNKKLNSELHGEVEFIQTSLKIFFFIPQQKWNFISDFRLQTFLSAFCEPDVQSFTVARWKDFLPHSEYKGQMSVKYKKILITNHSLFHYTVSHFGRNNKKMGHLEIFCLCFLYC